MIKQEIMAVDAQPLAVAEPSIGELMQVAIQQGAGGADTLAKLVDLKLRVDADNARKAFARAFVGAKSEIPTIPRASKGVAGGGTSYYYAELEDIQKALDPVLNKWGLSYSFNPGSDATNATATLILRHVEGHSESFGPFHVPIASRAGMSEQQKVGSAESYAKRYSLVAALSLRVGDPDTDCPPDSGEVITDAQLGQLDGLIEATGSDRAKFCAYFQVSNIGYLPAAKFAQALQMLSSKMAAKK